MTNSDGIFDTKRAQRLEEPGRLEELRPRELLEQVAGAAAGMTCVDLGSGTGVFALPLAELVGHGGKVYAVDASRDMVDFLNRKKPPPNLVQVQSDASETGLDSGIADVCLTAFVLHEVKSHSGLIAEARRLLKPGGRLVVVEWRADNVVKGPPLTRRISRAEIENLAGETGMALVSYQDWSENHYVAVLRK